MHQNTMKILMGFKIKTNLKILMQVIKYRDRKTHCILLRCLEEQYHSLTSILLVDPAQIIFSASIMMNVFNVSFRMYLLSLVFKIWENRVYFSPSAKDDSHERLYTV